MSSLSRTRRLARLQGQRRCVLLRRCTTCGSGSRLVHAAHWQGAVSTVVPHHGAPVRRRVLAGRRRVFWLAYELAHAPYFFSPWGASVVSSAPNRDVERYEATLCGCLCHFTPVDDATPELLYLNGRQVIDPVPFLLDRIQEMRRNLVFNTLPSHMSSRQKRARGRAKAGERDDMKWHIGLSKTPTPPALRRHPWRRRLPFQAVTKGFRRPLKSCDMVTYY